MSARAKNLALRMTAKPSISGSKAEAEFAEWLANELKNFNEVWTQTIPGGTFPRKNLFAIKRGTSKRTIVLTGHFDVVSVSDYGTLPAFDPKTLLEMAIAKLELSGENPLALADLKSGDFWPGRGLLDMKAGLAAGIAAIESYSGPMTLLFVAVADEENRSAGARGAVPALQNYVREQNLKIELIINLDAISDQGDGKNARVVSYGSIGKQLLTAYVVGKEAHAGYPRDGINAAAIAAELITAFEANPRFVETAGNEETAPPTVLCAKDLKKEYNVTTPAAFWAYWNTMQYRRSPADVLGEAMQVAAECLARLEQRFARKITLLTHAEFAANIEGSDDIILAAIQGCETLDLPDQCKLAMQALWASSGLAGPAVILGFGSIPYLPVALGDPYLRTIIERAVAPFRIGGLNYFAGISDMSFFGETAGDLASNAANTPVWGKSFSMLPTGGWPIINLGPWGRDYHHWLERLHTPYAFETLPQALLAVIDAIGQSR